MDFLKYVPSVFVIEKDYEILVFAKENGIINVKIGNKRFYEANSGVLFSEKNYARIRVPQKILDGKKSYTVEYRKTIDRKEYMSEFENVKTATFAFKPIEKTENINIYHVADVHDLYDLALKTASYYGDNLDLLILNGDIGEVQTLESYERMIDYVGKIANGFIPVIFVRGNHECRGKYAENYTDYFPNVNKKLYYEFEVGCMAGVILDCGEDKPDGVYNYGGTNIFEAYRREQTKFLKKVKPKKNKIYFAIAHIPPVFVIDEKGSIFDIERDVYSAWNKELERLNIKFLLSGHLHFSAFLFKGDERNIIDHTYPTIIGSALDDKNLSGAALKLNADGVNVKITNDQLEVTDELYIPFN